MPMICPGLGCLWARDALSPPFPPVHFERRERMYAIALGDSTAAGGPAGAATSRFPLKVPAATASACPRSILKIRARHSASGRALQCGRMCEVLSQRATARLLMDFLVEDKDQAPGVRDGPAIYIINHWKELAEGSHCLGRGCSLQRPL